MDAKSHANKPKLVTFLNLSTDKAELHIKDMKWVVRGGQKNCKYWNLRPVVMSDCSFIATRNSHAKHNKSVGRIPRGAEN